ncbi:6099_t:CDS:2 [Diversispora eburnea]|uniref:6099_t:CDS:1 n=1 Tax=Diversispora eburnea TaxID=1213867 RepID=A0A9N8VAL9_9GLOM|nr:6099_t:CDS:2 [Diversispora eburnea]
MAKDLDDKVESKSTTIPKTYQRFMAKNAQNKAARLPSKIIFEICSYLHPKDLYSLASVCKRYRSLLWSKKPATQEVWKNSRIQSFSLPTFPPPDGMCEQQYNWLLAVTQKCQYCGEKDMFKLALHWEFSSYCFDEWKVPEQILLCLVPLQSPPQPRKTYYLISDVIQTINEFHELPETINGDEWLEETQEAALQKTRICERYRVQLELIRYSKRERVQRILRRGGRSANQL